MISLAFGAQADWHRNLLAAGGGSIRHRGRNYRVRTPDRVDPEVGLAAFTLVQRFFLRIARIDGFVYAPDDGSRP